MRLDENLFDEILDVEENTTGDFEDLLYELAKRELDDPYLSGDELEDAISEEIDSLVNVGYIPAKSVLMTALVKYFGSFENVLRNVRSAVDFDGDGSIYFVFGANYDWISSDLLNGSADGQAKKAFLEFINK